VVYHNAFVTNHAVTGHTGRGRGVAGRSRWTIENEGNTVLKNQDYHGEHNDGHGSRHLCAVLLVLLLLAFLCHTVLQLADSTSQRVRAVLGSRKTFVDDIRALTRDLFFERWEGLLDFMIVELERSPSQGSSSSDTEVCVEVCRSSLTLHAGSSKRAYCLCRRALCIRTRTVG